MDTTVVAQKLESLRQCLVRIETKCPTDPAQLEADVDLQDIVSLNLSRALQLCVDIGAHLIAGMSTPPPDTMGQTFDILARESVLSMELLAASRKQWGFATSPSTATTPSIGKWFTASPTTTWVTSRHLLGWCQRGSTHLKSACDVGGRCPAC